MRARRRLARKVWRDRNKEGVRGTRVPWKNYVEVVASFPEYPFRAHPVVSHPSPRKDWKKKFVNGVMV
jgi:hypothetical protein